MGGITGVAETFYDDGGDGLDRMKFARLVAIAPLWTLVSSILGVRDNSRGSMLGFGYCGGEGYSEESGEGEGLHFGGSWRRVGCCLF